LYPGDETELVQYFSADESQWRMGPRSSITSLQLLVAPYDWVSVQPDSIDVEAADVITFAMKP
jgi:hypothetical protein